MTTQRPTPTARTANAAYRRFCERRDPAAIAELFDLAAADLHRTAMHLVGDAATADDLVQTTFLCAIESRTFDPSREVLPWLAGILRNQANLVHRRRARRFDPERLRLEPAEDPSLAATEWETQREVEAAIAQLNDAYQPVVRLHLLHGLDAGAIAASLGRPGGTVRTQLMRGLEKLRELLPVGIAGAVAGLLPTMGTAAVRTAVLAAASAKAATSTAAATTTVSSWSGGRLAVAALLITVATSAPFVWQGDDVEAPGTVTATTSQTVRAVPAVGSTEDGNATSTRDSTITRRETVPMAEADTPRPFEARGMVRDEDGSPVTGAEVLGFVADRPFFDGAGFDPAPANTARTDAEGRFALVMPTEQCYLVARDTGRFSKFAISGVAKGRESVDGLEFQLVPTSKLAGKVVDEAGKGMERIAIETSCRSSRGPLNMLTIPDFLRAELPRVRASTDATGSFEATVVPSEEYEWQASADGFLAASVSHRAQDGLLRIKLRKGATLRGVAFRADGSPAAGATAAIAGEGAPRTRCDANGRFELRGLKEGTKQVVLLEDAQSGIHCTEVLDLTRELRIRLEPPRTLAGRILDAAGMPAANAFVRIRGDRMAGPKLYAGIEPTWELAHRILSTTTDGEGTFAIERLYDGMFAIEVRLEGTSAFLPIGAHRAGLPQREFRLAQTLASSATLRGRAIDAATGAPLASLELMVMERMEGGSWAGESHTPELSEGTYKLVGMPTGSALITARADGYAEMQGVELELHAGPQTLDIALMPLRMLEVEAFLDGVAAIGTVRVFDADGKTRMIGSTRTGHGSIQPLADGKSIVHGLPAQRVRVVVESSSTAPSEQWVDLSGAGPHRIRFDLSRAEPQPEPAPAPKFELGVVVMFSTDASVGNDAPAAVDAQWLRRIQADPRISMPDKPIELVVRDMQGRELATGRIALATGTDPSTHAPRGGYSSECRMPDGVTISSTSNSAAAAAFQLREGRVRIEVRSEGRTTKSVEVTCDPSKPTMKLVTLSAGQ